MSKIFKDSISLTFAKIIQLFVDIFNIAVISRVFTLYQYGIYAQIFIISTLMIAIFRLGLPNSINYFLGREDVLEDKKHYMSQILTMCNIAGLIGFIIIFILKVPISNYFDNDLLKNYVFFYALLPWMRIVISLSDNTFVVMNKAKFAVLNRVIMSLIRLILPTIVIIFPIEFNTYMVIFIIIEIILYIYVQLSLVFLFKGLNFLYVKINDIKEILYYSVPLGLALIIGNINIQLDKFIIGYYFSVDQFAIYMNASKELPVSAFSASIVTIIMPSVVKFIKDNKPHEAVKLWNKTISFTFFIISPLILLLLAMSKETITLLYSSKYLPGINVFRIYTLILYFRVIYFGMILSASGNTKKIMTASIIALSSNVVLNVFFIKLIGYTGPAWATLISTLIITVYQLVHTGKIVRVKTIQLIPWLNVIKIFSKDIIIFILVMLIKVIILNPMGISSILSLIIIGILWSFITYIYYLLYMKKDIIL